MASGAGTSAGDPVALLTAAAAALADEGPDAAPDVLEQVVAALGLRSAVLRDAAGGGLRAVAGDVVHAVPSRRHAGGPEAVVELPVHGEGVRLATLTVVGARPSQLPLLRGVCAVLGLALTASATALPSVLLAGADADADAVADDLHDGPVQELVYARFAADAAARGGDVAAARDAVQVALQSLRRALWMLRPRGATDGGLAGVLPQLSQRLADADRPGLLLDLDPEASDALPAAAASVAYRLVQVYARTSEEPVAVALDRTSGPDGAAVLLRLAGGGPLPSPERWTARARAVGAALSNDPSGSVRLSVPVRPRTAPVPTTTARPAEIEAAP